MLSSTTSKSERPRLIPKKRPLKPISTSLHPRVLNPSAIPAETRLKPSYQEYLQTKQNHTDSSFTPATEEEDNLHQAPRIEVSFSAAQPFLDPPTWEAMLRLHREKIAAQSIEDSSVAITQGSGSRSEEESAERQRQRAEQEMEYGSMAIRGRSSVRGRGMRARGRGTVHWSGRS
ncbi:hypothetical protein N7508_009302 [Penicillium antarcticum]|uniref:uncharacterized protein n=1 Tax=Penicillium antarcticum TaxID=416450 RepID=UPI002386BB0F|nr:uncharacterized protein N7508_009302 [Penicillium antarcticum]KAJ5294481.1 hypothetical protein N7508_009302 [Penicillium antarcticum]